MRQSSAARPGSSHAHSLNRSTRARLRSHAAIVAAWSLLLSPSRPSLVTVRSVELSAEESMSKQLRSGVPYASRAAARTWEAVPEQDTLHCPSTSERATENPRMTASLRVGRPNVSTAKSCTIFGGTQWLPSVRAMSAGPSSGGMAALTLSRSRSSFRTRPSSSSRGLDSRKVRRCLLNAAKPSGVARR